MATMQQIQISFLGICTYLSETQPLGTPESTVWGHRMVLVNASQDNINRHPQLKGIEPHVARMQIGRDRIARQQGPALQFTPFQNSLLLNLQGVTLQVINASSSGPQALTNLMTCVPNLAMFKTDVAPGPAATDANPAQAACYFDFFSGALEGTTVEPANTTVSTLTMETFGDPQLLITPFQGGDPTLLTLRKAGPACLYQRHEPAGGPRQGQ